MSGSAAGDGGFRAQLVGRLGEVSAWFQRLRREKGWRCGKHQGVIHWGKLSYGLQIESFLYRESGDGAHLGNGLALLDELSATLRRQGDAWVFYPGLLHPRNASNNAIDSGATVDSLLAWWSRHGDETPAPLVDWLLDACRKVAMSYLVDPFGKPTNQMLWATTGLAAAWRHLELGDEVEAACRRAIELTFEDQNDDGSFPYLPRRLAGHDHPALHDVSGYYQSRHLSFVIDVADKLGYRFGAGELDRLRLGLDFLCALYGPDGRKSLEVEAKPWYWPSTAGWETASASFDLHALAAGCRLFAADEHRRCLGAAVEAFLATDADGAVSTPHADRCFQCELFWSAHAAWVTKALEAGVPASGDFWRAPVASFRGGESGVRALSVGPWHVKLRLERPRPSPLFGSASGGAPWSLRRRAADGSWGEELLPRGSSAWAAAGEVTQLPRGRLAAAPLRLLAYLWACRRELRFAAAVIRDHSRLLAAGRAARFFADRCWAPARRAAGGALSSLWATDARLEEVAGGFALVSVLATSTGDSKRGATLSRRFELRDDGGASVVLELVGGVVSRFVFVVPPLATGVEVEARRVRRRPGAVSFQHAGGRSALRFELTTDSRGEEQ